MSRRLVIVYKANAGLLAGAMDTVHKLVSPSTYPCSLCAVTYGLTGMRRRWADWIERLPEPPAFFHRPDFRAAYPAFADLPLPLVAREQGECLTVLLGAGELAALPDLDALIGRLAALIAIPEGRTMEDRVA